MMLHRRAFLTTTVLSTFALTRRARAEEWQPSERYPDPRVRIIDPSFAKYRLSLAKVERIATGMRWSEGPVWFGDGRYLLWSDIPNNRIMKWEEETGAVSVFRKPSNHSNGNTRDRQGRLVTCEHAARRVTRTEYDGSITVIADQLDGKPLNSPNDVDGNLWVGWGMGRAGLDGVSIFDPEGQLIGRIDLPERCANVCFGGRFRNRLFMCGSTSVYSLFVNTQGER